MSFYQRTIPLCWTKPQHHIIGNTKTTCSSLQSSRSCQKSDLPGCSSLVSKAVFSDLMRTLLRSRAFSRQDFRSSKAGSESGNSTMMSNSCSMRLQVKATMHLIFYFFYFFFLSFIEKCNCRFLLSKFGCKSKEPISTITRKIFASAAPYWSICFSNGSNWLPQQFVVEFIPISVDIVQMIRESILVRWDWVRQIHLCSFGVLRDFFFWFVQCFQPSQHFLAQPLKEKQEVVFSESSKSNVQPELIATTLVLPLTATQLSVRTQVLST